jgi:peptidoglycan/LPS O-acetylase OafA/YrhL
MEQRLSMSHRFARLAGFAIFVLLCGFPALELNGFGFGIPLSLPTALACATIGGAVGGVLMCRRPWVAGLSGGLLAGPLGLLAVYYYTHHRQTVFNVEVVFVQCLACLPGVGVGWCVKTVLDRSKGNGGGSRTG